MNNEQLHTPRTRSKPGKREWEPPLRIQGPSARTCLNAGISRKTSDQASTTLSLAPIEQLEGRILLKKIASEIGDEIGEFPVSSLLKFASAADLATRRQDSSSLGGGGMFSSEVFIYSMSRSRLGQ